MAVSTSTSATIRGISYSKGDQFTCYAAAKGTGDSEGNNGTAKELTKGTKYYFLYKATGDSVTHPYAIGTTSSGVQGWYKAEVFPYKTYTITYNANGGSGAPSSTTKNHGVKFTLSSTTPTRSSSTTNYTVTYNVNGGNTLSSTTATAKKTTSYTFKCWNTAKDGSGETNFSAGGSYTGNKNTTFYAQWNSSTTNTPVTLPTPTRSGYTFKGWYNAASGGNKVGNGGASYMPSSSITLYAQWSASAEYTLFYQPNGDNVTNMPSDQTKLHDTNLTISSTLPKRTGYTFSHWDTASDGTGYAKHPTKTEVTYNGTTKTCNNYITSNNDVTLYAIWLPITYTVKFNGNNSTSGTMSNQSFTYGTAQTLTANAFKREYIVTYNANGGSVSTTSATATYTFNNWNTNSDGSGSSYSNKQSVSNLSSTSGATVNLYAQWNTGSVTLLEPSRSGYAFNGWYTAASGGNKIGNDGDDYTPTAAITIYAQWTPITYTIRYNKNHSSASGSMADQTVSCGQYAWLSSNGFSLTNYDFKGWATSSGSSTVTYSNRQMIRDLGEAGDTINLYAVWAKKQYTITYNLNGGTGATAPATATVDQGGSHTVSSTTAYKAGEVSGYQVTFNSNGGNQSNQVITAKNSVGYKFLNWNTSSSGNGTTYTAGQKVTNIQNNLSLHAKYSTSDYSLLSNGSVTAPTVSKSSGTSSWTVNIDGNGGNGTTLTSNAPITYSCSGWYTENDDWRCNDKSSYTPKKSEILYAKWNSTTGNHEAVILPSNLTRTGYTLLGFATGSTSASAQYNPGGTYTPTVDGATLYAVWKPNVYTMTIEPNGGELQTYTGWTPNRLTTKFAYGTNTFIGISDEGGGYSTTLSEATTLQLGTRRGSTGKYNISLTYSSTLNDVNETEGVLSLTNPTSLTITALSNANVLAGNYICFNNNYYFIPAGTTFSEPSSGSFISRTYTLTCAAAQSVSVVQTQGSFTYNPYNVGRKENFVFSGYSAPSGKTFLNSEGQVFYFNGEHQNSYENCDTAPVSYIFNGQYAGDITITAQYRRAGFIITYRVNNPKLENTFSWNDTIHEFGIPGNVQTAESTPIYEFLGWNTKADGTGTWYSSGQQVGDLATNDGDVITLYAQWKLKNLVQVYKNGSFQNAQLYIWKDGKWNLTTVYLWKNNDWKMSTGH